MSQTRRRRFIKLSQSQLDFIRNYLAQEAHRGIINQKFIDWYRNEHKGREKWGTRKYSVMGSHPHGSNPYCNLCNEKFLIDDEAYRFYVGGHQLFYHINCFDNAREKMQLSIIYQDRAARKRLEI